jgi:putative membrane protein insertion efficiency factor
MQKTTMLLAPILFLSKQILKMALMGIRLYQLTIKGFLPPACRFEPSCSNYALEAIRQLGWCGLFLGVRRVLSCHPWSLGGYDPVPLCAKLRCPNEDVSQSSVKSCLCRSNKVKL